MSNVLIATFYHHYSVVACVSKFAIKEIYLLIDKTPNEEMQKSIDILDDALGSVIKIHKIKTDVYEILSVTKQCVEIIDSVTPNSEIIIDVTSGRKTKSFGLLFAAYTRPKHIKKIVYVTEETKQIISMPKMSYILNDTESKMLHLIQKEKFANAIKLSKKLEFSRGLVYRYTRHLMEMDIIEKSDQDELKLTEFGEILLL